MGRFVTAASARDESHATARLAQSQIVAANDHIRMGAERDHMGAVEANEALDALRGPIVHLVDHMLSRYCHVRSRFLFWLKLYRRISGAYRDVM